jgi:hypothetical protein
MRWNKVSNALRNGGREAISIPTDSSVEAQILKLMPSHVGSWVFVIAFSSTVLKIEHIVALQEIARQYSSQVALHRWIDSQ